MTTNPVSVRGGPGGISAHCEDMESTSALFGRVATDTADHVLSLHTYLVQPQVLESTIFDPLGAARFEARLAGALDGAAGVTALAVRAAALGAGLRAAAEAYRSTDRLDRLIAPEVNFVRNLPRAGWDAVGMLTTTGDVQAAAQRWLSDEPQAADLAMGSAAGFVAGASIPASLRLIGRLYPDGTAQVTTLGPDPAADRAGPPRSLAAVVAGLARRNLGQPGEVDVRILTPTEGRRRVIVDVPGTKDWSPAPHNRDITSIGTNLRALAGTSTSYERGVAEAMTRAGVRPDDDVLLVGHSEGGMVAVNLAIHAHLSGEFRVGHVVTVGAPIGAVAAHVPRDVHVLAVENRSDLVPHLDDRENPDRVNITTVQVNRARASVGDSHDLDESYVPGAADVDASTDPSVRAYLAELRPILSAESVSTQTYVVTRRYP